MWEKGARGGESDKMMRGAATKQSSANRASFFAIPFHRRVSGSQTAARGQQQSNETFVDRVAVVVRAGASRRNHLDW